MRLHYHPASTTCRPIMMFAADAGLALEWQLVDLFAGEHLQPAFTALNPSQCVPLLEDGELRLSESSAILKYLAEKAGSPAYPSDLAARARVNERMDWFNTFLMRDLCHGFAYPQLMPGHHRGDAAAQAATLNWARPRLRRWLTVLDEHLLGPRRRYVCGDEITLADYLGLGVVTVGEAVRLDFSPWPNVQRWLATMKSRPSYAATHLQFHSMLVADTEGVAFAVL
jgi:glutathione S-transferase